MITRKEVKDGVKNIIGKSINNNKEEIIIWWERWIDYKMCKKCWIWWKIPNKIVWHINSKWVITIHNRTCSILSNVNKERLLPAHRKWEEDNYIVVSLWLIFLDKLWVLKDLSEIIFSMWINIEEINSKKKEFNKHEIKLKLEIPDYDYLLVDRLVERVRLKFGQNLVSFFVEKIIM
jgi:(p)ppGpp synthase/HD superfamily hydrolase